MYATSKFTGRYVYFRHAGTWWRLPNVIGGWSQRHAIRELPADAGQLGRMDPGVARALGIDS